MPLLSAELLVLLALLGLLGWAVVSDLASFTIPNRIPIGVAALYPAWILAAWPGVSPLPGLTVGAALLVAGFLLFQRGLIGGGDAKLLAAVALWAGPDHLTRLILVTAVAGGILAAVWLVAALGQRRTAGGPAGTGARLTAALQHPVPYGIAIAAGGCDLAFALMAG